LYFLFTSHEDDGEVWVWGFGGDGQLGQGDEEDRALPVKVPLSEPVILVKAGHDFTVALTEKGDWFGWGNNDVGQLGVGNKETKLVPQRGSIPGKKLKDIIPGGIHCLGLTGTHLLNHILR
jgi:alpha-tubulin suppressor-like RCC1 family protein